MATPYVLAASVFRTAAVLLLAVTLSASAGVIARAETSAADGNRPCVLLTNDQVVFGTATQVGDRIKIHDGRRELSVRYQDVACWGDSVEDLRQYRVDYRTNFSLQSSLDEISWCLRYDLIDAAKDEWSAAAMKYPQQPELRSAARWIELRQNVLKSASSSIAATKPAAAATDAAGEVVQVSMIEKVPKTLIPGVDAPVSEVIDVNDALLHHFAREIQPLLLNRCGGCHSHMTDSAWKIIVPAGKLRPSAVSTRQNLASVLSLVQVDSPEESELMRLATTPHAAATTPAIPPGDRVAIHNLTLWLRTIRGKQVDSGDPPYDGPGGTMTPVDQPETLPLGSVHASVFESQREASVTESNRWDQSSPPPHEPAGGNGPSRLPAIDDPFDPERFNRRFHPQ